VLKGQLRPKKKTYRDPRLNKNRNQSVNALFTRSQTKADFSDCTSLLVVPTGKLLEAVARKDHRNPVTL
jgi:hypothetical protein